MSQQLIVGSVAIAVLDATVSDLQANNAGIGPPLKVLIGGFVVVVVLLVASDFNEELADAFAVLLLLATLFGPKGGGITKLVLNVTTKPTPTVPVSGAGGGRPVNRV